jgi:hypothetical protein
LPRHHAGDVATAGANAFVQSGFAILASRGVFTAGDEGNDLVIGLDQQLADETSVGVIIAKDDTGKRPHLNPKSISGG